MTTEIKSLWMMYLVGIVSMLLVEIVILSTINSNWILFIVGAISVLLITLGLYSYAQTKICENNILIQTK